MQVDWQIPFRKPKTVGATYMLIYSQDRIGWICFSVSLHAPTYMRKRLLSSHEHTEYGTECNRGNDTWLSLILPVDRNIMAVRRCVCALRYCFAWVPPQHPKPQAESCSQTVAESSQGLSSIYQTVTATHRALWAVSHFRFCTWCSHPEQVIPTLTGAEEVRPPTLPTWWKYSVTSKRSKYVQVSIIRKTYFKN